MSEYPKDQTCPAGKVVARVGTDKGPGRIDEAVEVLGLSPDIERKAAEISAAEQAASMYRVANVYLEGKRFGDAVVALEACA